MPRRTLMTKSNKVSRNGDDIQEARIRPEESNSKLLESDLIVINRDDMNFTITYGELLDALQTVFTPGDSSLIVYDGPDHESADVTAVYKSSKRVPTALTVSDCVIRFFDSRNNVVGQFELNGPSRNITLPDGGIGDEAPDDGLPYCRNGRTQSWVEGMPLDLSTLPTYTP